MRKLIWSLMTVLAFVFVSCTDETDSMGIANRTLVRLTPEGNVLTRATGAPQVDGYHLRYILEAYEQQVSGELGAKLGRFVQTTTDFELELAQEKTYVLLAWADYVSSGLDNANISSTEDEFYNTTDLKNVQMVTAKWALNTDAKDAFCQVKKDVKQSTQAVELTLKRPLAQLNIKTKEAVQRAKAVQLKYPNVYTAFNVFTGDVAGTASEQAFSAPVLSGSDSRVAYDYLFVHPLKDAGKYAQGSSLYNVIINLFATTETSGQADTSYEVEFVPFSPNYRTNLTCADIPAPGVQKTPITVSVDADFETNELTDPKQFINSSYIRPSFYQSGQIDVKNLQTCNDLIFFVAEPYTAGDLRFEIPDCTAYMNSVTYQAEFAGRTGVAVFTGGSPAMNGGTELLSTVKVKGSGGGQAAFTFGTWVYVDEWVAGAHLFKKALPSGAVGLNLGDTAGKLVFHVGDQRHEFVAQGLQPGIWHHVVFTYDARTNAKMALYVDGELAGKVDSAFGALPFARNPMMIGEQFKGKLDETFFNTLPFDLAAIKKIKDNGLTLKDWNQTKTQAYWKYDDENNLGHDSYSWVTMLEDIRTKIAGKDINIRLGVHHGDWTNTCKSVNRTALINKIHTILEKYHFDGVDLDFEWPENQEQWTNYSATVVDMKNKLGADYLLSASLHPLYYAGFSEAAVNACDWISMQVYGPQKHLFPLERYKNDLNTILTSKKIPADKLVPGLPFYGAFQGGDVIAYRTFVDKGLITSPDVSLVTYNEKEYAVNGQNIIREKVLYAREKGVRGVMSWDLATDTPYENTWSLQRTVVETIWQ